MTTSLTTVRIGTRGSKLALTQSRWVAARLKERSKEHEVELVVIKTTGDRDQTSALNKFAGKGIFTKEIEAELLAGNIDLAVHSLKDLPTELPEGLALAPPPAREDPRDAVVASVPLKDLPLGAVVGTGSARRRAQLQAVRPDLEFREIRGNVPTRVRKWREGQYDAVVLAAAGVARLGLEVAGLIESEFHILDYEQCIPAPCQGILGLEIREGDDQVLELLGSLTDTEANLQARAERAFLRELGGGCHLPAGAIALPGVHDLAVHAYLYTEEQGHQRFVSTGRPRHAESLGAEAARALKGLQESP